MSKPQDFIQQMLESHLPSVKRMLDMEKEHLKYLETFKKDYPACKSTDWADAKSIKVAEPTSNRPFRTSNAFIAASNPFDVESYCLRAI